ncbi:DUF998 domain-containing protein [Glutamicibacter halophytocola]|uniref:DUF998 domain-containing protein n=1 Tax=Glutamicibacter halophytocola TaxID=1933880 RepID=UPI00155887C8|nr:DUF998 domain-containing protein [Glutamicibacter halophytocola]NQD41565.1 DUF998 domain-containing protein [Glutamicibacter halophytocola]
MIRPQVIYRSALCGGALAYSSGMVSEAAAGWKLDPRITLLSELAARDRAGRRIFQAADIVAGTLFLAASAVRQHPNARPLRCSLAVLGAATIADALSPLDYPISHEHLRPAYRGGQGSSSISHRAHYVTTGVAGFAIAAICLLDWRAQRRGTAALRKVAGPAVVFGQLAGLAALASPRLAPGLVQRVQTLGFTLVCLDLARRGVAPPHPGP